MSEVTFHVEPWSAFKTEAAPLWPLHWKEIALNQDAIQLNVDFDTFDILDRAGQLCVVAAREEGQIVGYWLGVIRRHLHYRDSLTAYTDVFYMRKQSRRDVFVLQKMLKFVQAELKQRGVQNMFIATKCHKDLSAIFERMGMTRTEIVYSQLLKD